MSMPPLALRISTPRMIRPDALARYFCHDFHCLVLQTDELDAWSLKKRGPSRVPGPRLRNSSSHSHRRGLSPSGRVSFRAGRSVIAEDGPAKPDRPAGLSAHKSHVDQLPTHRGAGADPRVSAVGRVQDRAVIADGPAAVFVPEEYVAHLVFELDLVNIRPGAPSIGGLCEAAVPRGHPAVIFIDEE